MNFKSQIEKKLYINNKVNYQTNIDYFNYHKYKMENNIISISH